jgi:hypothetical protein
MKIKYILLTYCFCFLFISESKTQHYDWNYNSQELRTWRDSGYYFMPELVDFEIIRFLGQQNGSVGFKTKITSINATNGLDFLGIGVFVISPDELPDDLELSKGTKGKATLLIPLDLLFCPDDEQELNLGSNDPFFPLTLSAEINEVEDKHYQGVTWTYILQGFNVY